MTVSIEGDIQLTCGHCRRQPATHVLVAWCAAPIHRRISELVCKDCGSHSIRIAGFQTDFIGMAQMYPVQLVGPQQETSAEQAKKLAREVGEKAARAADEVATRRQGGAWWP